MYKTVLGVQLNFEVRGIVFEQELEECACDAVQH